MGYINSVKGGLIAFIFFIVLSYVIPGKGASSEVETILMVSTFLFAIFSGFFISRLGSRYDQIKDLTAEEDAHWLSLFKTSIFYGKKFVERIRELIDQYYIVAFDFDLGASYKHNAIYLHKVYDELRAVKITNSKAETLIQNMVGYLSSIEDTRNRSSVLYLEKLTKGQWGILFSLAGIIIYSIFYIKSPSVYSQVVTVLLSTILVIVLLIIRDLTHFKLYGMMVVTESGQEIFDDIGKERYFNKKFHPEALKHLPKNVKKYRLGLHKPGEKIKIKMISRK